MNNKIKKIILFIIILGFGVAIGYGVECYYGTQRTRYLISHILPVRENNFNYKFIYPLLRYDFGDAKYYLEDGVLEKKINNYIQQQYQSKKAESISVYFSNLLIGTWSGVNENTEYYPGSLMKVLIMMDYYRERQLDLSILKKSLLYSKEIDNTLHSISYTTPTNLVVGQSYVVQYLIEDMIENSDDGASALLLANDNPEILTAVYKDLNIPAPGDKPNFTISPKNYTLFLRILYSSTYLTEKNSESALSIMSKSTFKDGISAGLPSDIVAAQKFGEDIDMDPQGKTVVGTELHNCGIIYLPNSPYTLCVMTKARGIVNQKQLELIIKDISGIVYNYVVSGAKN